MIDQAKFECDDGHPCNACLDCGGAEVESSWRDREELLGDFDSRVSALDGIVEGLDESNVRRIELEVAIGTRDAIADLVDELHELNKLVRQFVDATYKVQR